MIAPDEITGLILAGGDGRRMGGVTKSLMAVAGEPLVAHVRRRLAPQVGAIVISANHDAAAHGAWGDPVIADRQPGVGPLGGLLAALEQVATPYLFCCPGDAPLLDDALVARLGDALHREAVDVAVPHDGVRVQPLFLLARTTVRAALGDYLAAGGRSVLGWIHGVSRVDVDCADRAASFLNINTRDALQQADRALAASGAIR